MEVSMEDISFFHICVLLIAVVVALPLPLVVVIVSVGTYDSDAVVAIEGSRTWPR